MGRLLESEVWPMPPESHENEGTGQDQKRPDIEPAELKSMVKQLVDSASATTRQLTRATQNVRIRNFRSEKYKLVEDLLVSVEQEGDQYFAASFDTGQYGYGMSPDDAIAHLCVVVEDYFELLLEDEARLSPHLSTHLIYLKDILAERQ